MTKMTKKSTEPKPSGPRLSPELDEFLHMLSALETQLAKPPSAR